MKGARTIFLCDHRYGKTGLCARIHEHDRKHRLRISRHREQRQSTRFSTALLFQLYASVTPYVNGVPITCFRAGGWYQVLAGDCRDSCAPSLPKPSNSRGRGAGTIKTPINTAVNMRWRLLQRGRTPPVRRRTLRGGVWQGSQWWFVDRDGYSGFLSSDFWSWACTPSGTGASAHSGDDDHHPCGGTATTGSHATSPPRFHPEAEPARAALDRIQRRGAAEQRR